MSALTHECVIARYKEDVTWAKEIPHVIYNKGPALAAEGLAIRTLPNVGKEAHTYLHHIVSNWDRLADVTLFTQAQIHEYVPEQIPITAFFDEAYDLVIPWLVRLRQWDADGNLRFLGPDCPFRRQVDQGEVRKAPHNFVSWFKLHLGTDIAQAPGLVYSPGGILSVRKSLIHARGIDFFNRLLQCVSDARLAEESWFLEQAWVYVFNGPNTRVRTLFRGNNPNAVFIA